MALSRNSAKTGHSILQTTGGNTDTAALSGGDVNQPNRVLPNGIGSDKSERRPGTGEVRLATAEHGWPLVESRASNMVAGSAFTGLILRKSQFGGMRAAANVGPATACS